MLRRSAVYLSVYEKGASTTSGCYALFEEVPDKVIRKIYKMAKKYFK